MPAISVLMPVYNAGLYLKEAIDSILNQTFKDFEFLIFNDGSTDNSKEILSSYSDPRIQVINFDINQGYVHLLNLGLDMAKGKYIARMDADDISANMRFEKQYEFLEKNREYILCGSNFTTIGTNRTTHLPTDNEEIKLKMLAITPFCHPSVLIRAETIRQNRLTYDEHYMPAEDLDLWVRLSEYGKMHNLNESLLFYRIHNSNISLTKRTPQQELSLRMTQKKYIATFFTNATLTGAEENMLDELFFGDQFDYNLLTQCGHLIRKIVKGNYQYKVDKRKVHSFLEQKYFYRCTTSTNSGSKIFFLANQFGFFKIPFIMNVKLLIKSLIKYQA